MQLTKTVIWLQRVTSPTCFPGQKLSLTIRAFSTAVQRRGWSPVGGRDATSSPRLTPSKEVPWTRKGEITVIVEIDQRGARAHDLRKIKFTGRPVHVVKNEPGFERCVAEYIFFGMATVRLRSVGPLVTAAADKHGPQKHERCGLAVKVPH